MAHTKSIRSDGGQAHGFGSDARDEAAVRELVSAIERDIAPIEVAVFNVGGNARFPVGRGKLSDEELVRRRARGATRIIRERHPWTT